MRRVFVCPPTEGGICHYTYSLADALQASGDDVTVLTYDYDAYDLAGLPHRHQAKQTLHTSANKAGRFYNPVRNICTLLTEARRTGIVHYQQALGPRTEPAQWRALKMAGKRIVYTAHDVTPHEVAEKRSGQEKDYFQWLYDNADDLIVHGHRLADILITDFCVPAKKVHLIPLGNFNFVADKFDKWDRQTARASLSYQEGETVVLFFGYVRPYKGLDTLIKACGIINHERPDLGRSLRLLVVGANYKESWREGNYEEQIREAGMADHAQSVNEYVKLEDVSRYFEAADVVALPYKSGSQSGILQLAFSFAKPAIVTNVGSISEMIQNGETGLVVPPDDPYSFAAALMRLLDDPTEASRLGPAGRKYADTELAWDRIALQTRQIYESLGEN